VARLLALIYAFGPVSGAHLNPVVTLLEAWAGRTTRRDALVYVAAQIAAARSPASPWPTSCSAWRRSRRRITCVRAARWC
jgi:hypothetical protein